jgi:hypothetical protein
MLAIVILLFVGFVFGYALPHPYGIAGAVAVPIVIGLATLVSGGTADFAWLTWLVTIVLAALAAYGGRIVRERYGLPGGRAASAR